MKQKINWMRLLIIGFSISIITITTISCGGGGTVYNTFIVTNEFYYLNASGHHVQIKTFNSGTDSTYILSPSDTLNLWENLPVGKSHNKFLIAGADSLEIIFDFGARTRNFRFADTSGHNILHHRNYAYDYLEDYSGDFYIITHYFVYRFTDEDFELAEPAAPNPF